MARTFHCKVCGDPYENPTAAGRPPVRCVNCEPKSWSAQARAAALERRRVLEATEGRYLALLKAVGDRPSVRALAPIGQPADVRQEPRLALSQAVRNVGRAQGRSELMRALDALQGVTLVWLKTLA